LPLKITELYSAPGSTVHDIYDRNIGVLVGVASDVNGYVKYIEVKVADRHVERVEGDRVALEDGKILVIPEWKHEALKVIEALERAYKRRRAIENIAREGDIPAEIVEGMRRQLNEDIKILKQRALKVKDLVKRRISEIEAESLKVAGAIANIQMLYFSGEIRESSFTASMNHLKRLKESLSAEKKDAKNILEKLEKTFEAATAPIEQPMRHQQKPATPPKPPAASKPAGKSDGGEEIIVQIEEA